ncbi:hypothetical protein DL769_009163 [Monosporascus sp. CRB-8-3]|nr:hypothetical protein DL769_009163 [Monosporascus sp. CRB-8-3]
MLLIANLENDRYCDKNPKEDDLKYETGDYNVFAQFWVTGAGGHETGAASLGQECQCVAYHKNGRQPTNAHDGA